MNLSHARHYFIFFIILLSLWSVVATTLWAEGEVPPDGFCLVPTASEVAASSVTQARIFLPQTYSQKVRRLHFKLSLPKDYRLLPKAGSEIVLTSLDGQFKKNFLIRRLNSAFHVNETFHVDRLRMDANIFYCKKGNKGLCLMKNVAFDVPLVVKEQNTPEDIQIDYVLPGLE